MEQDKVYDVLIVGAGPIGLATAIALRQNGINNILVIDQTHAFRRVGQIVDLLPNGLKAIKYINSEAYEQLKKTALELFKLPDAQKIKLLKKDNGILKIFKEKLFVLFP